VTLNIAVLQNGIIHHSADHRVCDAEGPVADNFPKLAFLDGHTWRMSIGFAGVAATDDFFVLRFLVDVLDKATWNPQDILADLRSASNVALAHTAVGPHSFLIGLADAKSARLCLISNIHYFDKQGAHQRRPSVSKSFCYSETDRDVVVRIGSGARSLGSNRFSPSMLSRYTARDWYDGGYFARCWLAGLHREAASRDSTVTSSSAIYSIYANGCMSELHGHIEGAYLPLRYSGGTNMRIANAMLGVRIRPGEQDASNYTIQSGGSMDPIYGSRTLPMNLFGKVVTQMYPRYLEFLRGRES
jgi:hypothetical protein